MAFSEFIGPLGRPDSPTVLVHAFDVIKTDQAKIRVVYLAGTADGHHLLVTFLRFRQYFRFYMFDGWSSDMSSSEEVIPNKRKRLGQETAWLGVFGQEDAPQSQSRGMAGCVEFEGGGSMEEPESLDSVAIDLCQADMSSSDEIQSTRSPVVPNSERDRVDVPKSSTPLPQSQHRMRQQYGKGFGLLQKLGYSGGGLGPAGDGRLEPVKVQPRRKQLGLQEGEASETSSVVPGKKKRVHFQPDWEAQKRHLLQDVESSEDEAEEVAMGIDVHDDYQSFGKPDPSATEAAERRRAQKVWDFENAQVAMSEEVEWLRKTLRTAKLLRDAINHIATQVTHIEIETVADLYAAVSPMIQHGAWRTTDAFQVADALLGHVLQQSKLIDDIAGNISALRSWKHYVCQSDEEVLHFQRRIRELVFPQVVDFFEDWIPDDDRGSLLCRALPQITDDDLLFLRARYILPKLKTHLRTVRISPSNQEIAPIVDVLQWVDVVPDSVLGMVLCDHLLPAWLETLKHWSRSDTADLSEVLQWYRGWRGLLPPSFMGDSSMRCFFLEGCRTLHSLAS
ncbi:MAG: hypothetical protein KVP17_003791 [Porospora cf. gigantea B]|uniref:uncharacterized protein n=1 Tax=Porospora cf. gigantea B TaxID=2853592 RepID=UPI003571C68C|nr:MAG: hypothetical protein KVP17_003791 [Porospora cf. gigantea B]